MGQTVGVDGVVGIVLVEGEEVVARHAVDRDEHTAGTEDPRDFGEDSVLRVVAGNVVQHVEGPGTREPIVGELERGGIAVDDVDVGSREPPSEIAGKRDGGTLWARLGAALADRAASGSESGGQYGRSSGRQFR